MTTVSQDNNDYSVIHSALYKIQQELKAPKGQYNKFGKYKYRSCEDILNAVKPLLPEGYIITLSDEIKYIGNWYYVESTATFTNGNISIVSKSSARESETKKGMDSCQITGSASSYARKYALNGLLLIDDNKDADDLNTGNNGSGQQQMRPPVTNPAVTPQQQQPVPTQLWHQQRQPQPPANQGAWHQPQGQ